MENTKKNSLLGKVAIVTGSGQGVGRGIAVGLAREGCRVITNNRKPGGVSGAGYRREDMTGEEYKKVLALRGDAEATAEIIRSEGGEAEPFFGDVSDYETARKMTEFAADTYGRIDILVNNAAGLGQGTILTTEEKDWDYITLAKMKGAYNTMHFAAPYMIRQGGGRIINCASDAWVGTANLCAYSAANAAVVGLSKAAAHELAQYGITVNVYCPEADSPGHVVQFNRTIRSLGERLGAKMTIAPEKQREVEADHGPAENLAPFIAYLATDGAAYINGTVFTIKASNKMSFYSEPETVRQIWKKDGVWTVDELAEAVPQELLYDYKSSVTGEGW